MKDPSQNIGLVLKEVRFKRGLTLDEASKLTGVSKAMLGQIERGESVPTISTLWKISTGLKLSFSEFLSSKKQDSEVIDINALETSELVLFITDENSEYYDGGMYSGNKH